MVQIQKGIKQKYLNSMRKLFGSTLIIVFLLLAAPIVQSAIIQLMKTRAKGLQTNHQNDQDLDSSSTSSQTPIKPENKGVSHKHQHRELGDLLEIVKKGDWSKKESKEEIENCEVKAAKSKERGEKVENKEQDPKEKDNYQRDRPEKENEYRKGANKKQEKFKNSEDEQQKNQEISAKSTEFDSEAELVKINEEIDYRKHLSHKHPKYQCPRRQKEQNSDRSEDREDQKISSPIQPISETQSLQEETTTQLESLPTLDADPLPAESTPQPFPDGQGETPIKVGDSGTIPSQQENEESTPPPFLSINVVNDYLP